MFKTLFNPMKSFMWNLIESFGIFGNPLDYLEICEIFKLNIVKFE